MSKGSGRPVFEVLVVFVLVFTVQIITDLANIVGGLFVLSAPLVENPWTIVTSVYAHSGITHLTSNAVALVLFGWPVARATTRVRFHSFFLLTGAFAGVSQVLLREVLVDAPGIEATSVSVLGASGAVFALLGYLLASNRLSSGLGALVSVPRWVVYATFLVVAVILTLATAQPGVALIAHFTGLLVGLLAGRLNALDPTSSRRGR